MAGVQPAGAGAGAPGLSNHLEIHDLVVTPRGDTATVQGFRDGRVLLKYTDPLPGADPDVTLHAALVRKCTPGVRPPEPVRVKR